jgi:hypothetical protein
MFTTGSKLLIGASVVALVATLVYGIGQDGVLGTVGLASATIGLTALAVLNALLRDSNVFTDDPAPVENIAAAHAAPGASVWPLGVALGAVVIAVGLVSYQSVVVVGIVLFVAAGAEWVIQTWAEEASSDPTYNSAARGRLSNPLEYPVGSAIAIGIVVYSFSRIMLWLNSKTSTTVVFSIVAVIVVAAAFIMASRPKMTGTAVNSVVAVGAIAIVAGGAFAGVDGQREIPEFETPAIWQEEAILHPDEYALGAEEGKHPAEPICESPEAFPEADEKGSETVASKSGAYDVILTSDGQLDFNIPGYEDESEGFWIPRSNATNVIFRNESDEERRLSLDWGIAEFEIEHDGETETIEGRNQLCTTLIESGGAQLLTIEAEQPSYAFEGQDNPNGEGDGFWFFVPGVDSATLEVNVP